MPWVTADEILVQSGAYTDPSAASPADRTWAELCAAAVSGGIDDRLEAPPEPAPVAWADQPAPEVEADLTPEAQRLAAVYHRRTQRIEAAIRYREPEPVVTGDAIAPRALVELSEGATAEITWAALGAGVEAYKRREATFGLTGYVDLQGAAIRVARDYLEAVGPIIARHATVGIA